MGVRQNKEIYSEIKELLDIPIDEPIFIIRAQDKLSIEAITLYRTIVNNSLPIGDEKALTWEAEIGSIRNDFINWQRDNRDKVKVPD